MVNKPLEWTSFDVVKKIRSTLQRHYNLKKFKVGHAGTLDPLADGLLIICTGKKTKEIDSYMAMTKVYSGVITIGATTPSYDLETDIEETFDITAISEDQIIKAAEKLTGEYEQYPPKFSAKKVKGQRAYDFARRGEDVKLKPKRITVSQFDITAIDLPKIHFEITCSKGTYIRSIARDFGRLLDNGGHLTRLRREKIGQFDIGNAKSVDEWTTLIQNL